MWQSLLGFSAVAALLTVTPGADSVLVLRTALVHGRRQAMLTGAGVCTGLVVWGGAAALGITAVLAASQSAYTALRIAGALYLTWLAIGMLRSSFRRAPEQAAEPEQPGGPAFRRGLLTNVLNPKVGIFYLTLLPQFVPAGAAVVPFTLLLTAVHIVQGLLWFLLVSTLADRVGHVLRAPAVSRWLDRTAAVVFLGFGVRLVLDRR